MSTDLIADMLSQIKNATLAGHNSVEFKHSILRERILKVLKDNDFIKDVKVFKESGAPYKSIHVDLIYGEDGKSMIRDISRVSKPGRRSYSTRSKIKRVDPRYGVVVVSTPAGVMSGEEARKKHLGGEVICEVK